MIKKLLSFGLFVALMAALPVYAAPEDETVMEGTPVAAKAKAIIINKGTIKTITASTLTVSKNGVTTVVQTDGNTKFRLRNGGKATIKDLGQSDEVTVLGKANANATVSARLIKDMSVGRRVFVGKVSSVEATSLTLTTTLHGAITVNMPLGAKFISRTGGSITQDAIRVGDRIRVVGLFRKASATVDATLVKNYDLPLKPASATPSTGSPRGEAGSGQAPFVDPQP